MSAYFSRMTIYRFRAFIWTLVDSIHILFLPLVWLAAFGDKSSIGGFTKPEIVTYYVVLGIVFTMATPHPEEKMNTEIRDGKVSQWIIRPFNYYQNFFFQDLTFRLMQAVMILPILGVSILLYHDFLIIAPLQNILLTIAASIIAFFALFSLSFSIGTAAFWLDDAYGVHNFYWFLMLLFGGGLVPIEFFPRFMQNIAAVLPFQYFHYFPVKLYLGQLGGQEIITGFIMLVAWLVAGFGIYKLTWALGLRRYSAVGG